MQTLRLRALFKLSAGDAGGLGRYFRIVSKERATWFLIGSAASAAILLDNALISPA